MRKKIYRLTITPALIPTERHQIQDALLKLGYYVSGGGTATDMTCCDISFWKSETDFGRKGGGKAMAKQKTVKINKNINKKPEMPKMQTGKKVVIKKKK